MERLEAVLVDLRKFSPVLNFDAGLEAQIYHLQDLIDEDFGQTSHIEIEALIRSLQHSLIDLLRNRKFFYMSPELSKFYRAPCVFGNDLLKSFPEASEDMLEAGNAYAANLNTGSVFHSMRVAEFGLRHVAAQLDIELTDGKKPLPVEFATWETVLAAIDKTKRELRQEPKSYPQNDRLRFYSDCGETLSHLKDLYRNDVMHTRRHYNKHNAMDAMQRVAGLMKTLAESPYKTLKVE
ncbi:hypothetical protein P8936_05430 [Edaphobacter paludis]|uniref:Cthe-2314-like HEPN domain-containing protein n=1 Tax=Edaphobacter paludis TaxID=3035702 RepID=A0AAU7D1R4_9BACT